MSDELETTTLTKDYSLRLPKLNDKTIYFARVDEDGNVTEKSYAVSSSFKGILRMSPNDYGLLSDNDSVSYDLTYSDSNDMYLTGGTIQVSDSDGYLIDLKLSKTSIEIDNTYIRGMIQADNLILFGEQNIKAFKVNDINYLPIFYNDNYSTSTGDWFCSYDCNKINTTTPIVSSEDIEESIESEIEDDDLLTSDKSGVIVSRSTGDTRSFDYNNTRTLIREVILDSLMSLQTVPPGSIHFVPVTIEQYQALMASDADATGDYPNRPGYNRYTTLGNEITNSLIRDYLPCDGRRYFCRDFPELAKLLKNEYVMYEEYPKDDNKYTIGVSSATNGTFSLESDKVVVLKERFNDYSGMTDEDFLSSGLSNVDDFESDISYNVENHGIDTTKYRRTFRVPDLRHKFVKAPWLSKPSSSSSSSFTTGLYTPDHLPNDTDDVHSHFMATAISNTAAEKRSYSTAEQNNPTTSIGNLTSDDYSALTKVYYQTSGTLTDTPAILSLCTNPTTSAESNSNDCWAGKQPNATGTRRRWRYPVRMSNFFWTVCPNDNDGTPDATIAKGKGVCSTDIPSYSFTDNFSTNSIYNLENNSQRDYYGFDNSPEYVACLPLIKI